MIFGILYLKIWSIFIINLRFDAHLFCFIPFKFLHMWYSKSIIIIKLINKMICQKSMIGVKNIFKYNVYILLIYMSDLINFKFKWSMEYYKGKT